MLIQRKIPNKNRKKEEEKKEEVSENPIAPKKRNSHFNQKALCHNVLEWLRKEAGDTDEQTDFVNCRQNQLI